MAMQTRYQTLLDELHTNKRQLSQYRQRYLNIQENSYSPLMNQKLLQKQIHCQVESEFEQQLQEKQKQIRQLQQDTDRLAFDRKVDKEKYQLKMDALQRELKEMQNSHLLELQNYANKTYQNSQNVKTSQQQSQIKRLRRQNDQLRMKIDQGREQLNESIDAKNRLHKQYSQTVTKNKQEKQKMLQEIGVFKRQCERMAQVNRNSSGDRDKQILKQKQKYIKQLKQQLDDQQGQIRKKQTKLAQNQIQYLNLTNQLKRVKQHNNKYQNEKIQDIKIEKQSIQRQVAQLKHTNQLLRKSNRQLVNNISQLSSSGINKNSLSRNTNNTTNTKKTITTRAIFNNHNNDENVQLQELINMNVNNQQKFITSNHSGNISSKNYQQQQHRGEGTNNKNLLSTEFIQDYVDDDHKEIYNNNERSNAKNIKTTKVRSIDHQQNDENKRSFNNNNKNYQNNKNIDNQFYCGYDDGQENQQQLNNAQFKLNSIPSQFIGSPERFVSPQARSPAQFQFSLNSPPPNQTVKQLKLYYEDKLQAEGLRNRQLSEKYVELKKKFKNLQRKFNQANGKVVGLLRDKIRLGSPMAKTQFSATEFGLQEFGPNYPQQARVNNLQFSSNNPPNRIISSISRSKSRSPQPTQGISSENQFYRAVKGSAGQLRNLMHSPDLSGVQRDHGPHHPSRSVSSSKGDHSFYEKSLKIKNSHKYKEIKCLNHENDQDTRSRQSQSQGQTRISRQRQVSRSGSRSRSPIS